MIRKLILALLTSALLALGVQAVAQTPASAAYTQHYDRYCTAPGAWQFHGQQNVQFNDNGTVTAYQQWIGYLNPGWLGLEYRWRVITGAGTTLFDTGYQTANINTWYNAGQYVFYPTAGTRIHMDAGRWNDGQPTCGMDIYF